jgi:flagellar biosynthesis protein FlgN
MDPQACLSQLARLLSEETALLGTLAQQLQREHELLNANDVDALDQAAQARQTSVAGLLRLDDERRNLCRVLGRSADQAGLAALLKWCDPAGSLASAHARCAEQAQQCREQNDRNGILVNARLNRVSGMLNLLGGSAGVRTYEPKGTPRGAGTLPAGRMLSTTA